MPEIATVPLNGLVALHLSARDLLAMTQGCSIRTLDEGKEFTASWDLPDLRNHMEDLKKNCPQALAVVCRLVARSVYLASDLPMSVLEVENVVEAPPLAMVVKEMDILDELTAVCEGKGEDAASLLDEPVPLCLKYWNEWNDGHVMSALKEFQSYWLEVREVYLAPPKPAVATAADPAVAGGMAKGFAVASGWRQPKSGPARPRRAKRITLLDEVCGWKQGLYTIYVEYQYQ